MFGRILISLTLAFVLGVMLLSSDELAGGTKLIITGRYVKRAPTGLDDQIWQKAQAVQVSLKGEGRFAGKEATVTTKAVYTEGSIYFLFKWEDPTRSIVKKAWKFDGQKWRHLKGNEDRISLLFEIQRIKGFATKGCAVTCHGLPGASTKVWKFATKTTAGKGDLWHWKAARSDPYKYADDTWLTVAGKKTGRKNDAGKGGDFKNRTEDKSRPLYMQDPAKKPSAPGFLLMEEAVKIADYSIFKAGDIITFRVPKKPAGSRFDIKALSRYAESGWTLMLYRKLDTGHEDDVAFNPKMKYNFAMALFHDSGGEDSYNSEGMSLQFSQ